MSSPCAQAWGSAGCSCWRRNFWAPRPGSASCSSTASNSASRRRSSPPSSPSPSWVKRATGSSWRYRPRSCAGKTASRAPEGSAMLVLDRVGKTYPNGVRALDGISLAVAPGEILVTIGGSGCGKSTMLRPFSGLDAFTRADLQDHLLDLWADLKPTLVMVTHDVDEAIVLADRIMVMRAHPGRVYEEIECDLPRPRDRQSAAFDFVKRRVLAALDRSLDRAVIVTDDSESRAAA